MHFGTLRENIKIFIVNLNITLMVPKRISVLKCKGFYKGKSISMDIYISWGKGVERMSNECKDIKKDDSKLTQSAYSKFKNMKLIKRIAADKYLLLMTLPVIAYYIIFQYLPMGGILIAFKNYSPRLGIFGSQWVGFRWFEQFFSSVYALRVIKNTLLISLYGIAWGFPIPVLFALFLNELRNAKFKKFVQTVSYLPHFISTVIICGMLITFLSPTEGIVNAVLMNLGVEPISFLNEPGWFRTIYVGSTVWQEFGWNSIIYLAAITSIDPTLYEAARIDGASRWRQMASITFPSILPTIIIMLILNTGVIMSVGYEKIILLYNPATYSVSDIISSFVYRRGLEGAEFSFSTAVSLFNSVVNLTLLLIVNKVSKKVADVALW